MSKLSMYLIGFLIISAIFFVSYTKETKQEEEKIRISLANTKELAKAKEEKNKKRMDCQNKYIDLDEDFENAKGFFNDNENAIRSIRNAAIRYEEECRGINAPMFHKLIKKCEKEL